MVKHGSIVLHTENYNEFILITDKVAQFIKDSGVREGVVYVISAHTTTGVTVNESLECLESDMGNLLDRLAPENDSYMHLRFLRSYGAMAGNPTGHLKSLLCGNHCVFPVSQGEIVRGGAQDIYFCEFDGPQRRTIHITVIGE